LFPSIGGAAWIASLLVVLAAEVRGLRARAARVGNGILAVIHLAVSPVLLVVITVLITWLARRTERSAVESEISPPYPKRAIVLAAPDPMLALYLPELRAILAPETLKSVHLVSMAPYAHELTRKGPRKLVVVSRGPMLQPSFEALFRARNLDWRVGSGAA
jgi:hypothetical protein